MNRKSEMSAGAKSRIASGYVRKVRRTPSLSETSYGSYAIRRATRSQSIRSRLANFILSFAAKSIAGGLLSTDHEAIKREWLNRAPVKRQVGSSNAYTSGDHEGARTIRAGWIAGI